MPRRPRRRRLAGERITRIVTSPYTRALQTVAPIAKALGVEVVINPIVRERYAFACDIGTPRTELERPGRTTTSPRSRRSGGRRSRSQPPRWSGARRCSVPRWRRLPDWSDTLVVSHWGFILSMTGKSVTNCANVALRSERAAARADRLARLTGHCRIGWRRRCHPCYPARAQARPSARPAMTRRS